MAPAPKTQTFIRRAELCRQPDPLQLAGRALGDLSRMITFRGTLKSASRAATKSRMSALAGRLAFAQHDRGGDLFAEHGVRHGEGDRLRHRRVVHEHSSTSRGEIFSAAAVMISLRAAGDPNVALRVHRPLVAGVEPAMREGLGVGSALAS